MASTASTVTVQNILDIALSFGEINPIFNAAQYANLLAQTIATDVMSAVCATEFPWKWNEINLPVFYTNSFQQDYALINPNGSSVTNLSWLERGIVVDINSNSNPKPYRPIEVGRQLPQATGSNWNNQLANPLFLANFFPNSTLYYGTWGQSNIGNSTLGNNPVSGSVYTNPLGATTMPANPINQIRDANGNLLVLTGFGHEGTTAPVAPANSAAGTTATPGSGATTVWTVVDPNGQGIRIFPTPAQTGTVWQFLITGQMQPVRFTTLDQTLAPLTDEYEAQFRQGFIAQCYKYSPEAKIAAKFDKMWQLWLQDLNKMRSKSDRELEENMFVPDRGIIGGQRRNVGWAGAAWPFNYPVGY